MAMKTHLHLHFLLFLLVLLPIPSLGHRYRRAHRYHTCWDLKKLTDLFTGEYNNNDQFEKDTAEGLMGSDFHFFVHRFQVPVKVQALRATKTKVCEESRQIYLEQCFGGAPIPQFQRIFNFVLSKDGHIFMETRRHNNQTVTEQWRNWRNDTAQFEDIPAEDLRFNDSCNMQWIRTGQCHFTGRISGQDCTFNFFNGSVPVPVYLRSEVHLKKGLITQDEQFISLEDGRVVSGASTPFIYNKIDTSVVVAEPWDEGECINAGWCLQQSRKKKMTSRRRRRYWRKYRRYHH